MSLATTRVGLTHLCQIDRDQGAGDSWGGDSVNWQPHLTSQPCRGYVDTAHERIAEGTNVATSSRHVILPPGLDVVAISDRVAWVTDQDGNSVLDGPMRIHAVIKRSAHIELVVERAS